MTYRTKIFVPNSFWLEMFLLCLKFKVLKLHFSIEFVLEAEISNLC